MTSDLITGDDGRCRCSWGAGDDLYRAYHDKEWGRPVRDDRGQFEFLVLESAQAGLSWITILRKREAYRKAYENFNPEAVARWGDKDVERLLGNGGIVRNRRKIEASIGNAQVFLAIAEQYGSFSDWIWRFVEGEPLAGHYETLKDVPVTTPLAERMAKEMKALGFGFLGPVILYSHMQATGLVDDHLAGCWRRQGKGDMVD